MYFFRVFNLGLLIPLLLALVLAGCASRKRIDWDSQIGVITYDQVLLEMGPPNLVANLDDGGKVAQWLEQSSRVYSTPGAYGAWGPRWGVYGNANVYSTPNVYLLLTFGPDQKLVSWRTQYR